MTFSRPVVPWVLILVWQVFVATSAAAQQPIRSSDRDLELAIEVGRWLQSQAHDASGEIPNDALENPPSFDADLAVGASGRLLFFLGLHYATDDSTFLVSAMRDGDAAMRRADDWKRDGDVRHGLFSGAAGVAFALSELYAATGELRFRRGAADLAGWLKRSARPSATDGVEWNGVDDMLAGTAGIGLALIILAEELDDPALLSRAEAAGRHLLDRAHRTEAGWWWWRGRENEFNLPNFSHGAAGIGFFLAALYAVTEDPTYLSGAERAADYVLSVADRSDGLVLVPYGVPNEGFVSPHDIGWAHGPAGTGRLFLLLWSLTDREEYLEAALASAATIAAAGVPGASRDPGRWTGPFRIDRRFGTAGVINYLRILERACPRAGHRSLAREIADDLVGRADRDGGVARWILSRYAFQGAEDQRAEFTGFFYGAAGLGLALLDVHALESGRESVIRLPDDPGRFSSRDPAVRGRTGDASPTRRRIPLAACETRSGSR